MTRQTRLKRQGFTNFPTPFASMNPQKGDENEIESEIEGKNANDAVKMADGAAKTVFSEEHKTSEEDFNDCCSECAHNRVTKRYFVSPCRKRQAKFYEEIHDEIYNETDDETVDGMEFDEAEWKETRMRVRA